MIYPCFEKKTKKSFFPSKQRLQPMHKLSHVLVLAGRRLLLHQVASMQLSPSHGTTGLHSTHRRPQTKPKNNTGTSSTIDSDIEGNDGGCGRGRSGSGRVELVLVSWKSKSWVERQDWSVWAWLQVGWGRWSSEFGKEEGGWY